ncbi:MAG: hypothetical protein KJ879_01375 [Nanoarchaeota archaeon]|nr:hypothetical protein [Nanoarchaeota archaeon]
MNYILIAVVAFLIILVALKWNNIRTKMAFYFIALGVIFILLMTFMVFSDGGANPDSIDGFTSSVRTYASWIGTAGSSVLKVSTYAFKQGWKDDGNSSVGD